MKILAHLPDEDEMKYHFWKKYYWFLARITIQRFPKIF